MINPKTYQLKKAITKTEGIQGNQALPRILRRNQSKQIPTKQLYQNSLIRKPFVFSKLKIDFKNKSKALCKNG